MWAAFPFAMLYATLTQQKLSSIALVRYVANSNLYELVGACNKLSSLPDVIYTAYKAGLTLRGR
jgi:hypothetical protein